MFDLHAIVYVSSATHLLETAELDRLLQRARERNAEAQVTGLLLYFDGSFMQYIEGPRDTLLPIYDIIRRDPQHHYIEELVNESIAEREFPDWGMAFRREMVPAFMKPPGRLPAGIDAEPTQPLGPGKDLLRNVWTAFRSPS